jgi:hypothetical protein
VDKILKQMGDGGNQQAQLVFAQAEKMVAQGGGHGGFMRKLMKPIVEELQTLNNSGNTEAKALLTRLDDERKQMQAARANSQSQGPPEMTAAEIKSKLQLAKDIHNLGDKLAASGQTGLQTAVHESETKISERKGKMIDKLKAKLIQDGETSLATELDAARPNLINAVESKNTAQVDALIPKLIAYAQKKQDKKLETRISRMQLWFEAMKSLA